MADTFGLSALARKRAELAGELDRLQARANQLQADLGHLDGAIRLLDPGFKPEPSRRKQERRRQAWFKNGDLQKVVLDVLRLAPEPLTVREVALAAMVRRELDTRDERAVAAVEKQVDSTLRRRTGRTRGARGDRAAMRGVAGAGVGR
jgi:hypothetical protein